jgi:hypothetical protein
MHGAIDDDRRRFLSIAAAVIAGAVGVPITGNAQTPGFGPPKQIDAGVLNIGYAEPCPPRGRPVPKQTEIEWESRTLSNVTPEGGNDSASGRLR